MWLYRVHVSTKFETNRSKNMATGAKKPPKWTFWRNNVATSLRHDDSSHIKRCGYIVCMFPPNLKQIDQKTWLRGPKNRQNGRYDAITSRRFYVMTFFSHDTMRLYHLHVSTKFEANRSKNTPTIAKNVFLSPPIASQHQNSKIGLHHYTRPCHTYDVSKYEDDRLRNKKV